jgi:hypothetical protein
MSAPQLEHTSWPLRPGLLHVGHFIDIVGGAVQG